MADRFAPAGQVKLHRALPSHASALRRSGFMPIPSFAARRSALISGVMPAGFNFPDDVDLWLRLNWDLTRHSRAAHFMEAIARHNATEDRPFKLSLSLGFSAFDPSAPRGIESLLEAADQQMYVQKRGKRAARV